MGNKHIQNPDEAGQNESQQEQLEGASLENNPDNKQEHELNKEKPLPLPMDDLVTPGKFGVTNSQLIPAIKQAIADTDLERLNLLRIRYLYTFQNSLKYLKKKEREFIQANLK